MRYANLDEVWGVKQFDTPQTYQQPFVRPGTYNESSYTAPRVDPLSYMGAKAAPLYNRPGQVFAREQDVDRYRDLSQQLAELYRTEGLPGILRILPAQCMQALNAVKNVCAAPLPGPNGNWLQNVDGHTVACAVIFGFVFLILWDLLCRTIRR